MRTDDFLDKINTSRKYRELGIPESTLRDLVEKNSQRLSDPRLLEKAVRQKLHNLVAPYLGDPDYAAMAETLKSLPRDLNAPEVLNWCTQALAAHTSTRERASLNADFYRQIFNLTGVPQVLADVACGLNPFSLPWMGLPQATSYIAYDLHQPRVAFINSFFAHVQQSGMAVHQDILVEPPQIEADVVLFLKEAHRFEQRERGANREFFRSLKTRWLLVSLPTVSMSGQHALIEQDRRLIQDACASEDWAITEILVEREIVFCIRKTT